MSEITEHIDRIRALIREYDEGRSSVASCLHDIGDTFIAPLLEAVENGDGYMTFGSCCCSSHPPDRKFRCEVVMEPHGFTVKRCP